MMLTVLVIAVFLVMARRRRRRGSRRGRVRALVLVIAILGLSLSFGAPAMAQDDDCVEAPVPEKPGDGLVGFLDPPGDKGEVDSEYWSYAYAGMVWHFHGDGCGGVSRWTNPGASFDTWAGNALFDLGKNIIGAGNALHYVLFEDWRLPGGLEQGLRELTGPIFDNVFVQLSSLCLLVVAVLLLRRVWGGDTAGVARRGLVVLAAMWFAGSSLLILNLTPAFARTMLTVTNSMRVGFVEPQAVGLYRNRMPTDLHDKVIHESWLRGEFGTPDGSEAADFGGRLLAAKAWTRQEANRREYLAPGAVAAKQASYRQVARALGTATGYFRGIAGGRLGVGFLALSQGLAFGLVPLGANLSVVALIGSLVLVALLAPVIGLVGMFKPEILSRIVVGFFVQVLAVLVISMLSGIHNLFLHLIFSPDAQLSLLTQMLLGLTVTVIFMVAVRSVRRTVRAQVRTRRGTRRLPDDTGTDAPEDSEPSVEDRAEARNWTTETGRQPDDWNQPTDSPRAETDVGDGVDDDLLYLPDVGVVDSDGQPVTRAPEPPPRQPPARRARWRPRRRRKA